MSKEFKNIDDLFRSELGQSTTKVPKEIKGAIDRELGFGSRKYLWFGIPLTLIFLTSIIVISNWENELTDTQQEFTKTEESNRQEQSPFLETSENAAKNDDPQGKEDKKSSAIGGTDSRENSREQSNHQKTRASNTKTEEKGEIQDFIRPRIETSSSVHSKGIASQEITDSQQTYPEDSEVRSNTAPETQMELEQSSTIKDPIEEGLAVEKRKASEEVNETSDLTKTSSASIDSSRTEKIRSDDMAENLSPENEKTELTETDSIPDENTITAGDEVAEEVEKEDRTNTENESIESDITSTTEDGVEFKKPEEKKRPWMITLEGGPNISRTFYDAKDVVEQDVYGSSMSDKLGTEVSLMVNYNMPKGFTFGTGFQYSKFQEDYDFVDEYWVYDSTSTMEIIYEDSIAIDSMINWNYDSTFVSNFNEQGINRASYLSLPINLGVQIPWGRFRFDLLATIRYNILLNASGLHYDDNSFFSFTHQSNNVYKRGYFDAVFAGNIHYNLFKNFYLTAAIRYRPVFGNTYNTTGLDRRFHYTHLGLGFSLKL